MNDETTIDGARAPTPAGMPYMGIVRRAVRIVREHRALWVFGILLALASGGGGSGGNTGMQWGGDGGSSADAPAGVLGAFEALGREGAEMVGALGEHIPWVIFACSLVVILMVVAVVIQYVSRVALIRMVDDIESQDARPTWREGWAMGWSGRAFRLFVLELVVGIIVVLAVLATILVFGIPIWLLVESSIAIGMRIVLGLMLALIALPLILVVTVFLSLLKQMWSREIAAGDRGVSSGIGGAFRRLRAAPFEVFLMWLLMLAIGIVVGFGFIIAFAVLAVPVAAAGFAAWAAAESVFLTAAVVITLGLAALVPVIFATGLYAAFGSTVWTLTWRWLVARDGTDLGTT